MSALAWLSQQTSTIVLSLAKQKVLLQQYRHNPRNWRNVAESQYQEVVNLAWHETTVKLPIVEDYLALKERLLAAVSDVVKLLRGNCS